MFKMTLLTKLSQASNRRRSDFRPFASYLPLDFAFALTRQKVGPEDFELLAVIGRGSFGKVMQVRHRETGSLLPAYLIRRTSLCHESNAKGNDYRQEPSYSHQRRENGSNFTSSN